MNAGSDPAANPAVRRASAADHVALRDVRLRALRDTPSAFGSTYEQEAQRDAQTWQDVARRWADPQRAAMWIAWRGPQTVGLVAGVDDDADPARTWLVSMWVDPSVRRRGLARRLVEEVLRWSADRGRASVHLHVTSNNPAARALYLSAGFVATGDSMPHPHQPGLVEHAMDFRVPRPSPAAAP